MNGFSNGRRLRGAAIVPLSLAIAAAAMVTPAVGDDRVLYKEAIVSATAPQIWKAWTTNDGLTSFFCKKADVELRVGGKYELYMTLDAPEGQRGTEGCHILSYIPERMLSFEWNAPPSIPALRDANAHTHVVIEIEPIGGGVTEVRLTQLGWGEGEDWDKCYTYFDRAWSNVLAALQKEIGKNANPVQRDKVLHQEYDIDAPREEVWKVLTTKEGLEGCIVAQAEVDMRVGGTIRTRYGADGKLGDDNTITHTILSMEPGRMYSSRVEAPADTPITRVVEDTWSVLTLDDMENGGTRMTIAACGWGEGKDWDEARLFFDKGNAWTVDKIKKYLDEKLAGATPEPRASVTPIAQLEPLSRIIGKWETIKSDDDGGVFHARVENEWGLDGKTINSKTFLIRDGKPMPTYESVYYWHPGRAAISFQSHAIWNALYDGTIEVDGDVVTGDWRAYSDKGMDEFRMNIQFTDEDSYRWTVYQRAGDAWKPVKNATWRRL